MSKQRGGCSLLAQHSGSVECGVAVLVAPIYVRSRSNKALDDFGPVGSYSEVQCQVSFVVSSIWIRAAGQYARIIRGSHSMTATCSGSSPRSPRALTFAPVAIAAFKERMSDLMIDEYSSFCFI